MRNCMEGLQKWFQAISESPPYRILGLERRFSFSILRQGLMQHRPAWNLQVDGDCLELLILHCSTVKCWNYSRESLGPGYVILGNQTPVFVSYQTNTLPPETCSQPEQRPSDGPTSDLGWRVIPDVRDTVNHHTGQKIALPQRATRTAVWQRLPKIIFSFYFNFKILM